MFFEQRLKWILLLLVGFSAQSYAQQNSGLSQALQVQPNKCVALNQGRDCFTNIMIRWQLKEKRDYCLFLQVLQEPPRLMKCWQGLNQGQWQHEFQSAKGAEFLLMEKTGNTVLASASMQVSWLYKASARKRRWRLF
jgi:hypothetical protein